jgi:hypothetical protein
LLLTGLYSAWLQVGTVDALAQTAYGQTLLLKGILLLLALGLAAFHLILGWRGGTARSRRLTTATLAGEALLAVVVLLVVGRLIGLEPAREVVASRAPTQVDVPLSLAADDGAPAAHLSISPGAVGVNTFTLDVDGTPLPSGAEAVLRFSLPSRDIGEEELVLPAVAPNRFVAEGAELALPGDWQITAIVRKIGAFSWQTTSAVAIGAMPPSSSAANPAPRFAPAGVLGMIAVAIGVAALAAAVARRRALVAARAGLAAVGAAVFIAGAAILGVSRLPVPSPAPVVAQEVSPVSASPRAVMEHAMAHEHDATAPAAATPLALPAPGTPVTRDGITVAVAVSPRRAGPAKVAIDLAGPDGKPLQDARVVVLNEMPSMPMGRSETPATETAPGHYVAEPVPLGMEGAWRLTIRVSPRGKPTQSFPFAVTME